MYKIKGRGDIIEVLMNSLPYINLGGSRMQSGVTP